MDTRSSFQPFAAKPLSPDRRASVAFLSPHCPFPVASKARHHDPIVARLSLHRHGAGAWPAHWPEITRTTL